MSRRWVSSHFCHLTRTLLALITARPFISSLANSHPSHQNLCSIKFNYRSEYLHVLTRKSHFSAMDCSDAIAETPADAYKLLLNAAMAIPLRHYLIGMLLSFMAFLYNFLEFHLFHDLLTGFQGCAVVLTYNSSSDLYRRVVSKCRTLHGRYLATPWLSSPHIQTSFLNFFGRPPRIFYKRQMFHASDGGTLALDWLRHSDVSGVAPHRNQDFSKDDTTPIVVMIPGLTSDSASPYMKHLTFHTAKHGWNVVVSNHRGLGGVSVTTDCFYNAGWTGDVREVIKYLHQEYPEAPLFVVGTSIGANILVKYLGEDGENVPVAGAAAVSSPWDLLIGSRFIARRLVQKLYDRALTIGLQGYAQLHKPRYSRLANWEGIEKSRSIRDFDTHATCLVGNYEVSLSLSLVGILRNVIYFFIFSFKTVDTYYRHSSSSAFVQRVSVPLLCISALDDPVCTSEAIPFDECRANKNIVLATTQHGGHLAFFEGIAGSSLWWVGAVNEFFEVLLSSPLMHHQKAQISDPRSTIMQSSIDQGPYLNIADDGMVAATDNGQTDFDVEVSFREKKNHDQTNTANSSRSETELPDGVKSHLSAQAPEKASKETSIVKRCLNLVSQQNSTSTWLLAYIAILMTWPVAGAALGSLFRKKFKKASSGKIQK